MRVRAARVASATSKLSTSRKYCKHIIRVLRTHGGLLRPHHGDHAAVAETRAHAAQEADQEDSEHRGQEQEDRQEAHLQMVD